MVLMQDDFWLCVYRVSRMEERWEKNARFSLLQNMLKEFIQHITWKEKGKRIRAMGIFQWTDWASTLWVVLDWRRTASQVHVLPTPLSTRGTLRGLEGCDCFFHWTFETVQVIYEKSFKNFFKVLKKTRKKTKITHNPIAERKKSYSHHPSMVLELESGLS